jgi:hypothetical protein
VRLYSYDFYTIFIEWWPKKWVTYEFAMIKNNRIPNTRCNYTECTNVKNIKCNWCNEWRHNEHNWNYKNQTQTTRIKMDTNIDKCRSLLNH